MQIPIILQTISDTFFSKGGRAIIVGGSVRDHFLGLPIKDYDIEVFGLPSIEDLEEVLSEFGSVNLVGKSFGVLKLFVDGEEYDFSLPRIEEKTGRGHRGFDVKMNGEMNFKEASRRRDFTINAMGYDIEKQIFLDPYNGREDMEKKVLRHIDADTFVEDPLRVYRAVQFAARFGYVLAHETETLCRKMVVNGSLEELPKERIYTEWKKLLLKAPKPSVGFELMQKLGILEYCFPELYALIGVPQDPVVHPEGDVWAHTMMSIDAMASILREQREGSREEKQKLKLLFAVLCHDFGKPLTTTIELENGETMEWNSSARLTLNAEHFAHIRVISHEKAGIEAAKSFMYRLTDEHDFIESILPLVEHHLKPSQFYVQRVKAPVIRRLATKINIEELVAVAKADFFGCATAEAKTGIYKAGEWLLEKAKDLKVQNRPLENFLKGRDLIALGMRPSPAFKMILNEVYELQMDGVLTTKEEARAYVHRKFLL